VTGAQMALARECSFDFGIRKLKDPLVNLMRHRYVEAKNSSPQAIAA
jgi:hypothetical protein